MLRCLEGDRDIAVHDDQPLHLAIAVAVIERLLDDFLAVGQALLREESRRG